MKRFWFTVKPLAVTAAILFVVYCVGWWRPGALAILALLSVLLLWVFAIWMYNRWQGYYETVKITPDLDPTLADEYGFDASQTTLRQDNPFWDATDYAHAAWWRGCDYGCQTTANALQTIAVTGKHSGVFGGKEIEEAAQAIMTLHKQKEK